MRQKGSKLGYFWSINPSGTCAKAVCTRLSQRQHAMGCPVKPRGCDCPTQLRKNPILKCWKFREYSSIRRLNILKNSGGLKQGFFHNALEVWGLKPLSKIYGSGFTEIRTGNRWSCPKSWTYRPDQSRVITDDLHMRAPLRSKGHHLTAALKEIRRTRVKRLFQWHAEYGHGNILFTVEKHFTIQEQYNNQYNRIYAQKSLVVRAEGAGGHHPSYVMV